jgi:hypothetical protein
MGPSSCDGSHNELRLRSSLHAEAEAKWPDCQPPDERRAMSLAPPSGLTVREKATTEEFR